MWVISVTWKSQSKFDWAESIKADDSRRFLSIELILIELILFFHFFLSALAQSGISRSFLRIDRPTLELLTIAINLILAFFLWKNAQD